MPAITAVLVLGHVALAEEKRLQFPIHVDALAGVQTIRVTATDVGDSPRECWPDLEGTLAQVKERLGKYGLQPTDGDHDAWLMLQAKSILVDDGESCVWDVKLGLSTDPSWQNSRDLVYGAKGAAQGIVTKTALDLADLFGRDWQHSIRQ